MEDNQCNKKQIDFLKRLAGYYLEVLKNIRSTSTSFLKDITQGRTHDDVDLSFLVESEPLLTNKEGEIIISPPKTEVSNNDSTEDFFSTTEISVTENQLNKQTVFKHLRELEQKYKLNPYEREFLYAYPFLVGKDKDDKYICAPLFTVKSNVDYDLENGQIKIFLTGDLEINTYVLKSILGEAQFQCLQKQIIAKGIPSLPLDEKEFLPFLMNIINVAPDIFEPLSNWDWLLEQISKKSYSSILSKGKVQIKPYSALLFVGRTDYYLRNDLETLQMSTEDFKGSVLTSFFSNDIKTPPDDSVYKVNLDFEDLIYPFEANHWQKDIAKSIEKHSLVTVQGPPGTGKSQTIANLICHLVSQGKTVLLTSQKNQALEVVSDKWLNRLNINYLFMTLLKGDTDSKRELLRQLDGLDAYIDEYSFFNIIETEHEKIKQRLNNLRKEIQDLKNKFEVARKRENENYQHYEKFNETRKDDTILEEIKLPKIDTNILTDDLFNYCKVYIDGSSGFERESWFNFLNNWSSRNPQFIQESNKIAISVMSIANKMEQIASLVGDEPIITFQKKLIQDETFGFHSVSNLLDWVNGAQSLVIEFIKQKEKLKAQYEYWEALLKTAKEIGVLDDKIREKISSDINALSELIVKMLQNLPIKWYQLFRKFRQHNYSKRFDEICECLPLPEKPNMLQDAKKEKNIFKIQKELNRLRDIIFLADSVHQTKLLLEEQSFQVLKFSEFEDKSITEVKELLRVKTGALQSILLTNEIKDMLPNIKFIADAYEISNLLSQNEPNILAKKATSLKSLAHGIPYYAKLKEIENKLGKVADWVRSYCDKEKLTEIESQHWDIFNRAVIAHRLYEFFAQDLKENAEDTQSLSKKLNKLKKQEVDIIKKLLEINIKRNLLSKYSQKVSQEIQVLKKALRKGKKKFASFEYLKEQIDFKEILKVLPCWIMSIDDVCRIFPLEPGLFDVLIVDEASQCHLMGALPLLYRAKNTVVVGDSKQLPNADLMFLSSAINQEKMREYGIESLPRGNFFDVMDNSLIQLAEIWKEKACSLREHFRCLPEIIRFCNERFYGWLKIMTHSLDIPPDGIFEIRNVEGAFEEDNVNKLEAEELINDVFKRMKDSRYNKFSFGILSPFREQANYLETLLEKRLLEEPELRARFSEEPIICSTYDGFQGNERDIIFYSFRYASNSHPGIFAIERGKEEMGEKRMNVAFSRARKKVVCYICNNIEKFPRGLIRDFLTYIKFSSAKQTFPFENLNEEDIDNLYKELEKQGRKVSDFEKDVFKRLHERRYIVIPQYSTCGFYIDIVMSDNFGRRIAIECDGMFHYEDGELRIEDLIRQETLERVGWYVYRIPSRKYWSDPTKCINDTIEEFEKIPY